MSLGEQIGDGDVEVRLDDRRGAASLAASPRFDRPIPSGGYQWHYVDAVSDDGAWAIVIIALVGSPFSANYARERARGTTPSPLAYSALNVALYGPRASTFSLRERQIHPRDRRADELFLGGSAVRWRDGALTIDIDERATPFGRSYGRPIRGRVVLRPEETTDREVILDEAGRHRWWPRAPHARVEVELDQPDVRWTGNGYHDANAGDEALEQGFQTWTWSRGRAAGRTIVTYDVLPRSGSARSLAMSLERGRVDAVDFVRAPLGTTIWGVTRSTLADHPRGARVVRSLEDGPFYTRALVETTLGGERFVAMHETLSADRLAQGWVRFLAGFRTGRAA